jgi:hypothetical protein
MCGIKEDFFFRKLNSELARMRKKRERERKTKDQ